MNRNFSLSSISKYVSQSSPRTQMLIGDVAILMVAFIWGSANTIIRFALADITPFWFCGIRFAVACATVMYFFRGRMFAATPGQRVAGSLIGMVFISAYLVGAVAVLYTTAGNVSFIISMSVVFVPLAVWVLTRHFPGWHIVLAVVLCTLGLGGLVLGEGFSVSMGDLLAFASMLFVTANIILVQKFVRSADPYALACWQSLGGMVLALGVAFAFEPLPIHMTMAALVAIVYTATVGFALTLILQNVAQKYTSASHVAILLATSGIFGSVTGVVFLGEPMTARIFISSVLILLGVLIAEAGPVLRGKKKTSKA